MEQKLSTRSTIKKLVELGEAYTSLNSTKKSDLSLIFPDNDEFDGAHRGPRK